MFASFAAVSALSVPKSVGRAGLYETDAALGFVEAVRFLDGRLFRGPKKIARPSVLTLAASACYHGSAGILQQRQIDQKEWEKS
jgi:hypothetical protein